MDTWQTAIGRSIAMAGRLINAHQSFNETVGVRDGEGRGVLGLAVLDGSGRGRFGGDRDDVIRARPHVSQGQILWACITTKYQGMLKNNILETL